MQLRCLIRLLLLVVLFVPSLQTASSAKDVEVRTIWETDNGTIRLHKELGKPMGFSQPREFREDEMYQILSSLYYSQHEYFHWRSSIRVFEEDQARILARPFQDALMSAGPDDVVEFYFVVRSRKLFGIAGEMRSTRGKAFIKAGEMQFRFDQMYQVQSEDPSRTEDSLQYATQVSWKLVPMSGQHYGSEKDVLGNDRENVHWICLSLQEPVGRGPKAGTVSQSIEGAPAQSKVESPAEKVSPDTKAPERLRELKKMLDDGLITQEDYDRKKKEILDSF